MTDQMRLTADVFVLHDDEILLLRRRGLSEGMWYIPGGIVELGEDVEDAAIRETLEESGLRVANVAPLRTWGYEVEPGRWAYHATFVANAPNREVVISEEHGAARWCTPQRYLDSDLAKWEVIDHPVLRSFTPQVKRNVELLLARLR